MTYSIQELISRIGGADNSLVDIAKDLASQGKLLSEALSDLANKVSDHYFILILVTILCQYESL